MLKTVLTILGVLTLLLIALIGYAACVAAGREDRAMEHLYEKWAWSQLPDYIKWICSFLMLAGRLEIMSVLVLFTRGFWKDN